MLPVCVGRSGALLKACLVNADETDHRLSYWGFRRVQGQRARRIGPLIVGGVREREARMTRSRSTA